MEGVKLNEPVARRLRTVCGHARVSMRGRQATGDAAIDITADTVVVVFRLLLFFSVFYSFIPVNKLYSQKGQQFSVFFIRNFFVSLCSQMQSD